MKIIWYNYYTKHKEVLPMNLCDIKRKNLSINDEKIIDLQLKILSDTKLNISYPSGITSLNPSSIKVSLIGFTEDENKEIEIGYVDIIRLQNQIHNDFYHCNNIKEQLSSETFSTKMNEILGALNEIKNNYGLYCKTQDKMSLFYIAKIFVNKECRNNGIGELLLIESEKLLKALYERHPFIFLTAFPFETKKENPKEEMLKLFNFYKKCGFEPINSNVYIKDNEE